MKPVEIVASVCIAFILSGWGGTGCGTFHEGETNGKAPAGEDLYRKSNLVAWCIVPFDAKKRGPSARAKMLKELGIRAVAYDWRQEHVPTFEEEILEYKKHDLEFFAFWSWHDDMEPLIRKHGIHPQIWMTNPSPEASSQDERVKAAAKRLLPFVEKARELGCKFGLYNHGRWGGEPENLVAVCTYLRAQGNADHVGIVYNFHHGHQHIDRFAGVFALIQPYLLCVNINGMADPDTVDGNTNKIVTLGEGKHERRMLRIVRDSGYNGPIGILGHRADRDVEECLRLNLQGLARLER